MPPTMPVLANALRDDFTTASVTRYTSETKWILCEAERVRLGRRIVSPPPRIGSALHSTADSTHYRCSLCTFYRSTVNGDSMLSF